MSVIVIWESHFSPTNAAVGLEVTQAIWHDMQAFDGYLGHELIQDADDAGHLLVVSSWRSREIADALRDSYATNPNAQKANALVETPRRRFVGRRVDVRATPSRSGGPVVAA